MRASPLKFNSRDALTGKVRLVSDVIHLASKILSITNKEAEQQILGGILLNNEILNIVSGILQPEHFSALEHAEIYRISRELIKSGKTANPVTLKSLLSFQKIAEQPAVQYLLSLCKNPASALTVEDYAKLLINLYGVRELRSVAEETMFETGKTGAPLAADIATMMRDRIDVIESTLQSEKEKPQSIGDISDACIERLEKIRSGEIEPAPMTGITYLDDKIGGWYPGRFYVVGGRPGQGKTIFGVSQALRVSRQKRSNGETFGSLFITLEVPYHDIWSRLVSCTLADTNWPIPYQLIQKGRALDNASYERVINAAHNIKKQNIEIVDRDSATISQIDDLVKRTKLRREKDGKTLDVVFIDYLGLVRASDRYKGFRVHEITEISAGLLGIAKRHDVAVVALAQLSRNVEGRENKIPSLSDLRDSGSIEQDANAVIFLYREAYYKALEADEGGIELSDDKQNDIVLNVAKSRDGSTGLVMAYVDVANNMIRGRD